MRPHSRPFFVVAAAGIVAACGGSETRWAGTITDSAGVTIVSNTDVGIWAPGEEWTVEGELRIGTLDGPSEYQIGQVGSVAIDSKGRILVLDGQAQHIRVYSSNGTHDQTIGGRGGGPGELRSALALLMGPGDTLLVPDRGNLRFSRFAPDGSSAGSSRMVVESGVPMQFRASASGVIAEQVRPLSVLSGEPADGDTMDVLLHLASDGTVTDTIMKFPSGRAWTPGGGFRFFEAEPVWDLVGRSEIVLAAGGEFRIGIYADGRLERIVTKISERRPVSEEDKAALLAELDRRMTAAGVPAENRQTILRRRFQFAEFFPAVLGLAAGPLGTIWVQHTRPPSALSEEELASIRGQHTEDFGAPEWEVFDSEGRFLGVVVMPERFRPLLFRDDAIYGVGFDELNVEYVVRLRIVGDLGGGAT